MIVDYNSNSDPVKGYFGMFSGHIIRIIFCFCFFPLRGIQENCGFLKTHTKRGVRLESGSRNTTMICLVRGKPKGAPKKATPPKGEPTFWTRNEKLNGPRRTRSGAAASLPGAWCLGASRRARPGLPAEPLLSSRARARRPRGPAALETTRELTDLGDLGG